MPTTVINVSTVEEITSKVIKQIQAQEDSLNNIDRIINSMEGVWESESQKVYAEKFRQTKARIQNFNESINESLNDMRTFVDDCVSVDEQTARELRNISW